MMNNVYIHSHSSMTWVRRDINSVPVKPIDDDEEGDRHGREEKKSCHLSTLDLSRVGCRLSAENFKLALARLSRPRLRACRDLLHRDP